MYTNTYIYLQFGFVTINVIYSAVKMVIVWGTRKHILLTTIEENANVWLQWNN